MFRVVLLIIIATASLWGCSIMILNHSHGNYLNETTDPQTELPIQVMGKGNTEQLEPLKQDTIKTEDDGVK